jgi:gliding motility-associated-like protein
MKKLLIIFLTLINTIKVDAQITVWQETFDPAPIIGWNLNVSTGLNDAEANFWEINDNEGGVLPPGCGVANNNNNTLHVAANAFWSIGTGAVYNAGGFCGTLFCVTTHTRAETPNINTLGFSNMNLSFDYIENGDGTLDNFKLFYSTNGGSTYTMMTDPGKTILCTSGQGQWATISMVLPASCNNLTNFKLGFGWENNDDGLGTDPSVAINNIKITSNTVSNHPPYAATDNATVYCGQLNNIIVLGNDTDADLNTLTVTQVFGNPQFGVASLGASSLVKYTPNPCSPGTDSFYYVVCDNGTPMMCDTGKVIINAPACGCALPPVAVTDTLYAICGATVNKNLMLNDFDPNAGQIISLSGFINNGTIVGTLNQVGANITFTPTSGYIGVQSFLYIICDNGTPSLCDTGTVVLIATACNIAPNATNDTVITACGTNITIDVLQNDKDSNFADVLTFTIIKNAKHGSIAISNNKINYNPTPCFSGLDSIEIKVCDNGLPSKCDTSYVFIKVDTCNCLKPTASFIVNDSIICAGDCISFTDLNTGNATSWNWTFAGGNPSTSTQQNPSNICFLTSGNYNVSLVCANSFGNSNTFNQNIKVNPLPASSVSDGSGFIGDTIQLNANISGAINYYWVPTLGLSNPLIINPTFILTQNTEYVFHYMNADSCFGAITYSYKATPKPGKGNMLWVPNAISTNGDYFNDWFIAKGQNIATFQMQIYNRWGNQVFETTDIKQGWNGTYVGIDNVTQVFFYLIRVTYLDGSVETKKGDITVLK